MAGHPVNRGVSEKGSTPACVGTGRVQKAQALGAKRDQPSTQKMH